MPHGSPDALRASLIAAIREASHSPRGVPASLEDDAREFARAQRVAGVAVEKVIIDVKAIVRSEAGELALLFLPRIVGWTVAGYFAGTPRRDDPR